MGFYRFIALALFSCAFVLVQLIPTYAQNSPQVYVSLHNSARAAVGVGPMKWNKKLADYAQNYANKRRGDCRLIYSGGPYGENIYRGSGPAVCTAAHAVRSWLSEKKYYNYQSNTCQRGKKCRHYTQVVCRKSDMLGCASVKCKNKACFIICLYFPRCNVDGRRPY